MAISLASISRRTALAAPRVVIYGPHGAGKALEVSELVLTPFGWKAIGELAVGDVVCTPSGEHAAVTGVYPQGIKPLFRVTTNLGASVLATDDHLWFTSTRDDRANGVSGRVRNTRQIGASLRPGGALSHRLPQVMPQQFCHESSDLPVPPYLLGAWLGDGTKNGPKITNPDNEVLERIRIDAQKIGANVFVREHPGRCRTLQIGNDWSAAGRPNPFLNGLRELGLMNQGAANVRIPDAYLWSSVESRRELLMGLLDTDGYASKTGVVQYYTISRSLADDVAALVRSLGGAVRESSKMGQYKTGTGETIYCQECFTLTISLPADAPPFSVQRKAERWHSPESRYSHHFIESVEPAGAGECVCISVDHPEQLFLTRDYIPTHNTTFGASAPAPVLLPIEDGIGKLAVEHFPLVTEWAQAMEALAALYQEAHTYQTLVVDSLDWMEPLVWAETCRRHQKASIEDWGYGKGYLFAEAVWRELFDGLIALRNSKQMTVVLIAHCDIKRFEDPNAEPYDRYQMKLQARAAALVEEWADCVLFANFRTYVAATEVAKDRKVRRGVGTGERVMYTEERPAFRAKNRYGLPPEMPLSWPDFAAALNPKS